MNTSLLLAGAALLLVAVLGSRVTIGGNQILPSASWWVQIVTGVAGLLAIAWALLASRGPVLWTGRGFLGAPPKMPPPKRMVARPDLSGSVVAALRTGGAPVAVTGIGGVGKSTLAAAACGDRRARRRFRDGMTWLLAGPGQDPVALLSDLARRWGVGESQSGFTTVVQGRDKMATVLRGKRMLIALDNVWEPGPLDALIGLAPDCKVMFTTRLPELATTFGATEIQVDELTQGQALELLGRWTDRAPAQLPPDARTLCTRVGNLALGVAMAAAMVARGRSFADVAALIEQDLARVHADLDPAYPYRNLLAAIEAGIADLPEADQRKYARLAVFAGRGPFPREAAAALWRSEPLDAEVGDLLAELTGRSLLTAAGHDRYAAHDLQYDVLKRRLGLARLSAAHARLLDSYRDRYPGGWADSVADPYLANTLAGHLHEAGCDHELQALLADAAWIQARVAAGQLPDLLSDYSYSRDQLTAYEKLIEIGRAEESYPVRLAIAQEIGSGGDKAFDAIDRDFSDPAAEYLKRRRDLEESEQAEYQQETGNAYADERERRSRAGRGVIETKAERETREDAERRKQEERTARSNREEAKIWREFVLRAWLAPMLIGSVSDKYREDAERHLAKWLNNLKPEEPPDVRRRLPISLEIALAQGFKAAANRRPRNPHTRQEARAYLVQRAEEMLTYARHWFTQMTLIHALCLWTLSDDSEMLAAGPDAAGDGGPGQSGQSGRKSITRQQLRHRASGPEPTVARWLAIAGTHAGYWINASEPRLEHPFVAEAAALAALALESGHPERYLWIDESSITSKVGSRAALPADHTRHDPWIPPSAGWSTLDRRAQQLVADVLVMLNLADRTGANDSLDAHEFRLQRSNRISLPPCLTRDRNPLQPNLTIGSATTAAPGTTCLDGCAFELCPYPPSGAQPWAELSEAFCRRQQILLASWPRPPGRRTAPWQGITAREMRSFWGQMTKRASSA